jgi:membrane protein YqaA with SNARE-associated domain
MPNKMAVVNPSKALVALVAMVCITVLMALERIAAEAATGMLGAIVGYAIGNGIAAAQHMKVTPIIGERNTGDDT